MSCDITVIGEMYLDHVFSGFTRWPDPGTEIFTEDYRWELGGGAVNTACALARLGRTVKLIGVVGQDSFDFIARRLAHFQVSAEHLIVSESHTGVTVSVSVAEERSFFSYRGANAELLKALDANPEWLRSASESRHIHLALPLPASSVQTMLPMLASRGATTSLDVGYDIEWLRSGSSIDLIRAVDYLLPNAKEAELMRGSVEEYLRLFRANGSGCGVVKLGAAGAVMVFGEREFRVQPPNVDVKDTTGAGDAFNAGFIDGLLSGLPPRECLELGCICGSLSTRAAGSLEALPSREEIGA